MQNEIPRRIIQILKVTRDEYQLWVLCDDGTVWWSNIRATPRIWTPVVVNDLQTPKNLQGPPGIMV
jgi:hypothetical protein